MFGGASLTAREWAKYGQLMLNGGRCERRQVLDRNLLAECFQGTAANPGYGMTFWLPVRGGINSEGRPDDRRAARLKGIHAPASIIKAGAGGQKLYIIPSRNLVIVRQATRWSLTGSGFDAAGFLAALSEQAG